MGKDEERKDKGSHVEALSAASIGLTMVLCTAIGLAVGVYLDRNAGTSPFLTIAFFVLGVTAGFWQMIKEAKRSVSGVRKQNK
jgi:ATP synthase protein I